MAISKERARSVKHAVLCGDEKLSGVLDGTNTVEILELTGPASKVTVQTSDTLAITAEYSLNGITFFGSQAAAAGVPVSYSTHNIGSIKVTRTAGTGRVTVLAT
jgi:hypothetical protein